MLDLSTLNFAENGVSINRFLDSALGAAYIASSFMLLIELFW